VVVREIHPIKFSLHIWDMLESYFLTGAGGCKGKYPYKMSHFTTGTFWGGGLLL